jgi:uncharacterized protein YhaN
MKINEIHIYGYGKLENLIITDLSRFQVLYGENEAGKSTLMSFIHSVLFGFPTKQQSDLRYEPKTHTKYGGKLIIQHPTEGQIVIERVKGKATGDVMVRLESGTQGGEELLSKLMKKMDKSLFQSIFSFNLHGLQNIHHVKATDLGKFLFSTSAIGTDKLLKVEYELKKEIENRFKPGGRKPILNEKLKELQELQIKVKEAQRKNDTYSSLIHNRISLEEKIKMTQLEIKSLHLQINRMKEWKIHFPNFQELLTLRHELEQTSMYYFPLDGIKRYESLVQLIKPLEAQLSGLIDKYERLQMQLDQIEVNEELIRQELEVDSVISKLPIYEQLLSESVEINLQLDTYQFKIRQLKDKLHFPIDETELTRIDTSIFMKERVGQAEAKHFRLGDQRQMLESRFQEEKIALEQVEKEINYYNEQILTEEKRESLIQEWKQALKLDQKRSKLKEVQEKIEFYKATKSDGHSSTVKPMGQTIFLLIFLLFLTIWSGLNKEWELLFVTSASFIFIVFLYLKKFFFSKPSSKEESISHLYVMEQQLMVEINASKNLDSEQLKSQIQMDDKLRDQLQASKLRLSQQQIRYDQVIHSFEKWELDTKRNEEVMMNLFDQLRLPKQLPFERLSEAFQLLSDIKELIFNEQRLRVRLQQWENKSSEIRSSIITLSDRYLVDQKASLQEMVIGLREVLKQAHHNALQVETINVKLEEIKTDIVKVQKEHDFLVQELKQLMSEAEVKSEEEFRTKGKEAMRNETRLERIMTIESGFKIARFSIEDYRDYQQVEQINVQMEEWNQQLNHLEEIVLKHQDALSEVKYQIALLEEGGTYSELLHRYKHLKYELEEQARTWGAYAVARHLLSKTIETYKNEKLPSLIKKAEEYLCFLTLGTYTRIHTKEDESSGFIIERNDHTFFEANELSQATMEQVYVSIRLALATTLFENEKFPIIIDDSFVNFDHIRTERVLRLLSNIEDHQILFFTCHAHLIQYFEENQILHLNNRFIHN